MNAYNDVSPPAVSEETHFFCHIYICRRLFFQPFLIENVFNGGLDSSLTLKSNAPLCETKILVSYINDIFQKKYISSEMIK